MADANGYGVFHLLHERCSEGVHPGLCESLTIHDPTLPGYGTVNADCNNGDGQVAFREAERYAEAKVTFLVPPDASLPGQVSSELWDELHVLGQPFNDDPVADAGGPAYYSGDVRVYHNLRWLGIV